MSFFHSSVINKCTKKNGQYLPSVGTNVKSPTRGEANCKTKNYYEMNE